MTDSDLDKKLDEMENIDEIDNVDAEKKSLLHKPSDEEVKLDHDLKRYYKESFDLNLIWRVIPKDSFETREFGFNLLKGGFTRNKSFKEPLHLKEYLYTFPVIGAYIGSLYGTRLLPKDRYNKAITIHNSPWVGRELIFDLDLDDYNLVRKCSCEGKNVCEDCWGLMQEAADILDDTLRVDFGFNNLEWVYTGGRGYHCWVLDEHTFSLDQEQRAAIVEYMQLIHDPKGLQKLDKIGDYAELLKQRIYTKIGRNFILNETKTFLKEHAGFTDTTIKKAREKLEKSKLLRDIVDSIPKDKEDIFLQSLILNHYPRIDHKVTIDIRRLIRMPGSIHIRSKNISQFISNPTTFNPINDATNMYDVLD
ncbi:MAG: DNA primase catalytic subunit PriS [Candidatus Heimdallarchaeota archaeon]|nr:DNA primase catalytic subunit PriS [Candidatus Heimdallarchaeota archaeon]